MSLNLSLSRLLKSLEDHVLALREEGVRTVEWRGPAPEPAVRSEASSPKPPPAKAPASVSPPPPPAPPSAPVSRPGPVTPPPPPAAAPEFQFIQARRLPLCSDDPLPAEESLLGILCVAAELSGENRVLLENMLAAIGYRLEGEPRTVSAPAGLPPGSARVLCFGDAAQQSLSPMKMALGLVRGKWQRGAAGKFMALFPPSYLHDNPAGKKAAWGDLQNVLKDLGLRLPPRQQG